MKTYFTFMKESHTPYPLYHKSYTDAINAALAHHKDLNVSDEDRDTHIAMGPRKPAEGETVKHHIPATDKNGDKHMIHIQVYNKGGNKPFELNTYSSKVSKKKVAEETVNVSEGLGDVRPRAVYTNDTIGDPKALIQYTKTLGPKHIDYHDLMTAASHMAFGNENHLAKHVKALDTDVRDKVKEYLSPEFKKRHLEEEVELDEQVSFKKTISGHHIHHNGERVGKIIKTNSMGSLGYSVRIGDDEVSSERSLDAAKESAKYHLTSLKEQEELDEADQTNLGGGKGPIGGRYGMPPGTTNRVTQAMAAAKAAAADKAAAKKKKMARVNLSIDYDEIGHKTVAVGPGQKETLISKKNFKEEVDHKEERSNLINKAAGHNIPSKMREKIRKAADLHGMAAKDPEKYAAAALAASKALNEEQEELDEVSKDLAGRYIKAAKYNQIYKVGREGRHYAGKRIDYQNREKGIDTAIKKLTGQAKVPATNEEAQRVYEEHMSEKDAERLAQKHVNAAISAKKAGNLKGHDAHAEASNYIRDKILTHTDSAKGIPSGKIRSTAKKLFGKADLAEKEEMEINELDRGGIISRYIRKAGPGGSESFPKRKKGVDLALLKKWGDTGYGLPEPKVKAVQREEVEPLAEISAALARRASRLAMDE